MIRLETEVEVKHLRNFGTVVKPLLKSDKSNARQKCTLKICQLFKAAMYRKWPQVRQGCQGHSEGEGNWQLVQLSEFIKPNPKIAVMDNPFNSVWGV